MTTTTQHLGCRLLAAMAVLLSACPSATPTPVVEHSHEQTATTVDWGYPTPTRVALSGEDESWPATIVNAKSGYELVRVAAGSVAMGSPDEEPGHTPAESPVHTVELSTFYVGRREVTNAEYQRYLDDTDAVPPANRGDGLSRDPDRPVTGLSWNEAQAWCDWAGLRLPTEAQWEYAARAGSIGPYSFGDDRSTLHEYSWCESPTEAGPGPMPIGVKRANAWGVHDMHGNVWEWAADVYVAYTRATRAHDGLHDGTGEVLRSIRGGSWKTPARMCRSASRSALDPEARDDNLGFRAVGFGPPT